MRLLTFRKRLSSLLAKEIEAYLPQFEPYTSDYQMVLYACRDLETWIECKWCTDGERDVYEKLQESSEDEPDAFRSFLSFWAGCWLEKWRERVGILPTKPKLPTRILETLREAKRIYRAMEYGKELKKMVIQKLVREGEICMAETIAEHLIIQEIAGRIQNVDVDSKREDVDALDIFNCLSYRISALPKERGPLVYLNMKPYML